MTLDHGVATRLRERSLAWRLGASTTAAIGVVLLTWALSVDFVKASNGGFIGDAATYYTLGHSLATDLDFEYQRDDLARVWKEYPVRTRGPVSQAGQRRPAVLRQGLHLSAGRRRRSSGCSAPTASWCCTRS